MFTVIAGKYDGWEENCKYVDNFLTIYEALDAYKKVCDYPWARIEVEYNRKTVKLFVGE